MKLVKFIKDIPGLYKKSWKYEGTQIRYLTRAKRREKFTTDSGGDIKFQKYVSIEDLDKYLKWGKTTKFIQDQLKKKFKKLNLNNSPKATGHF